MALIRVDLPHPTGPTTMVTLPRGTAMFIACMQPNGCFSLSQPKCPFAIEIAVEDVETSSLPSSNEERLFVDAFESFSETLSMSDVDPRVPMRKGDRRRSSCVGVTRNFWILWKDPTPPMNEDIAIMRELSGSDNSVKSDNDVKTLAVSSVLVPLLFWARVANTANVRMGDMSGEKNAAQIQLGLPRIDCNSTHIYPSSR